MKVTKVVDIETSDSKESFEVAELVGHPAAFAYHINYQNYGFGKFRFDKKSLAAFTTNLSKIEDNLSRKQVFNILYDMLKENHISGAQVLEICKTQLVNETAVDVLTDVMRFVIPVVIKNYIPLERYEQSHKEIFELFLSILAKGTITDKSTQHLVLDAILTSARSEEHYAQLINWLNTGFVHDINGTMIENAEVSLKHKHSII